MIDINLLSKKERKELSCNVESWFPSYHKNMAFKGQFHKLKQEVNVPNSDKEVWAWICCVTRAIRYGNTKSFMSFSSEAYTITAKVTSKPLNHNKMTKICNKLESLGYVFRYRGFKFEEDSCCSIISFNEKLLSLFDEAICKRFGASRNLDLIEIYDTTYEVDKKGKEVKVKTFVNPKGKNGAGAIKISLTKLNRCIEDNIITVEGKRRTDILYKRIFEESFSLAGRWYTCGTFQSLSKKERQTIKINGKGTCSVDYKSIHPNALRTILGIKEKFQTDPYTINVDFDCDKSELRALCKVGLMCILFNRTKGKAVQALADKLTKDRTNQRRKRFKEDQKYKTLNNKTGIARVIIEKLMELNSDISSEFFQEKLWAKLQAIDSAIAKYVIDYFTNKNIVILPWHDSFVIDNDYKEELISIMEEGWKHVLGDTTHFNLEVEFSNYNFPRFIPSNYIKRD